MPRPSEQNAYHIYCICIRRVSSGNTNTRSSNHVPETKTSSFLRQKKKRIEKHVEADGTSISYEVLRYQMVQHNNLEHKPKVDCFNQITRSPSCLGAKKHSKSDQPECP